MNDNIKSLNTKVFILSNILVNKINKKYNMTSDFNDVEDLLIDLKIEKSLRERNVIKKARAFELLQMELKERGNNLNLNNIFRIVDIEEDNSLIYNKSLQENIMKSTKLNIENKEEFYEMDVYSLKDFDELKRLFNNITRLISPEVNLYSTEYDKILFEYANKARLYKSKKFMKFYYRIAEDLAKKRNEKFSEEENLLEEIKFLEYKINHYDESINTYEENIEEIESNDLLNKKDKLANEIEQLIALEEDMDELFLMAIPNNDENIYLN